MNFYTAAITAVCLLPFVCYAQDGPTIACEDVPPVFWCKNKNISELCNVTDKCNTYFKKSNEKKILLTVLYEILCQSCAQVISGPLKEVYETRKDQVDIELVPFGNARYNEDGSLSCQHGVEECNGNRYEACAINFIEDYFPFIACVEGNIESFDFEATAKKCYADLKTPDDVVKQIEECYNGQLGHDLIKANSERSVSAEGIKYDFVPWIFINNVSSSRFSLNSMFDNNLLTFIDEWHVKGELTL
ncbi:unnamed protein product [Bursaphelenchus okinawaensis]|uniref:Saposin A-type domain-containing protein n=1 Tax=Bursaphelenchus okinawaensis TaxID=465554 RepID=A0A811LBT1_9BILA|nr:unnamed protein product [Bursaphelenchus okinawaensis]CAG9121114.1 unnamed protein product [Bursaphelenchus okinawaensis]